MCTPGDTYYDMPYGGNCGNCFNNDYNDYNDCNDCSNYCGCTPPEPILPQPTGICKSLEPMDTCTIYRNSYSPICCYKRPTPIYPRDQLKDLCHNEAPLERCTVHRMSYLQPDCCRCCSHKPPAPNRRIYDSSYFC